MNKIEKQLKLVRRELNVSFTLVCALVSLVLYYVTNKDLIYLFGSLAMAIILLIAGTYWYYQDKKEKTIKHKSKRLKKRIT